MNVCSKRALFFGSVERQNRPGEKCVSLVGPFFAKWKELICFGEQLLAFFFRKTKKFAAAYAGAISGAKARWEIPSGAIRSICAPHRGSIKPFSVLHCCAMAFTKYKRWNLHSTTVRFGTFWSRRELHEKAHERWLRWLVDGFFKEAFIDKFLTYR